MKTRPTGAQIKCIFVKLSAYLANIYELMYHLLLLQKRNKQGLIPDTVEIKIDAPLKHTKLGITSIVIAILVWLYFFLVGLLFFYGGISESIAPRDSSFEWALIVVFTFLAAHLVVCSIGFIIGLVFGAVGLLMKDRKRVLAAIGLTLNIFPLVLEGIGIIYFFYL